MPTASSSTADPGASIQRSPSSGREPEAAQANSSKAPPPLRIHRLSSRQGLVRPSSSEGAASAAAVATAIKKRSKPPSCRPTFTTMKVTPATTTSTPRIPVQFSTSSRSSFPGALGPGRVGTVRGAVLGGRRDGVRSGRSGWRSGWGGESAGDAGLTVAASTATAAGRTGVLVSASCRSLLGRSAGAGGRTSIRDSSCRSRRSNAFSCPRCSELLCSHSAISKSASRRSSTLTMKPATAVVSNPAVRGCPVLCRFRWGGSARLAAVGRLEVGANAAANGNPVRMGILL